MYNARSWRKQQKRVWERPWFEPLQPWPPGMRFEDGPVEPVVGRYLPPPPAPIGAYGGSGRMCIAARFAEPEIDNVSW
jgi:hypothetical protein